MKHPGAHLNPDEIDLLMRSHVAGVEDSGQAARERAEALEHLTACDVCRRVMDVHVKEQNRVGSLRVDTPAERGPECPPEACWLEIAAGLTEPAEARVSVQHASSCEYCGPLLRSAIADFADELTPPEEELLKSLRSSRPGWQRRLAAGIGSSQTGSGVGTWIERGLWRLSGLPAWVPAGVVAALAVGVLLTVLLTRETPVEDLLASAYTQQRTMEMRIPNAGYAPVRLTRGSIGRSRLDRPPALLEGEARIARELERRPNSPAVLQSAGRADLLEWNYQAAIRDLTRALELAPATPSILTDLASAYFQSAEANQRASDYAKAVELLEQALKSTPDDPVALFNLAIVFERSGLRDRAIEVWRRYLLVDSASGWASEAKDRLADVQRTNR